MRSHIDWLTFTMSMQYSEGEGDEYARAIERAFNDTFDAKTVVLAFGGRWEAQERSRAPYKDAWTLGGDGITLFASPTLVHCCVEISGSGCERLIGLDALQAVLSAVADRVTRIDIACDIETDVRPSAFVAEVSHERMRASGNQISETGETAYVGSQKSDRYARVYRYNAPHPRAHLLRCEHVFRRDYAKTVAQAVLGNSVEGVANAAGKAFGWAHPVWQPSVNDAPTIALVSESRKAGASIFWLTHSVAPAFKRLVREGAIKDPEAFFKTYMLD